METPDLEDRKPEEQEVDKKGDCLGLDKYFRKTQGLLICFRFLLISIVGYEHLVL